MNSKVLVTGGAGFIGSAVVAQFQRSNYDLYVIDNLSFGKLDFLNVEEGHFIKIDIQDRMGIFEVIEKIQPEIIIHLAAVHFIPYCNAHPFESANINIQGTMNILDAAAKVSSVKKILFASTAAVYPIWSEAVNEGIPVNPLDIYGLSKLAGERLCNEFYLRTKIPTIICRFFNAFGPNETNPHLIPEIAKQINAGSRTLSLGNLTPKRDFIHTADMANAVQKLVEKFESGIDIFNLGSNREYSVTEIVEYFELALSEKLEIVIDPLKVRSVERMHLLADISKLSSFIDWSPQIAPEVGIKTLLTYQ